MYAEVIKVTEKSILVGVKNSKYSQGFDGIGYCANPDKLEKGAEVVGFPKPAGTAQRKNTEGEIMRTKDGEPLTFWVF